MSMLVVSIELGSPPHMWLIPIPPKLAQSLAHSSFRKYLWNEGQEEDNTGSWSRGGEVSVRRNSKSLGSLLCSLTSSP